MPISRSIFILSCVLLFFPARVPAQEGAPASMAVIGALRASKNSVAHLGSLPFSAADANRYFSTALDVAPQKLAGGGTVFERPHGPKSEDRWRIEVRTQKKKNLFLVFTVRGNVGMARVREFFESPLFQRDEYESFYAMLNVAKNGPTKRMRRFTVKMTLQTLRDAERVTILFTPPQSTSPPKAHEH